MHQQDVQANSHKSLEDANTFPSRNALNFTPSSFLLVLTSSGGHGSTNPLIVEITLRLAEQRFCQL